MKRGFTLLEMLVATAIMGVAVVALLSDISASLRNASRLAEHDRAAVLARQKMDELLLEEKLPLNLPLEGRFNPAQAGGVEAGWRAVVTRFEALPDAPVNSSVLQQVHLEIWWIHAGARRTLALDGYRPKKLTPEDVAAQ